MEVLDFYATWCPSCHDYEVTIDQADNELSEVKFTKINIDTNEEMIKRYSIAVLPTTIILKGGQEVWKGEGKLSLNELMGIVQEYGG